jgi:hypothetical protein
MKRALAVLVLAATLSPPIIADAQTPTRIRGTVAAMKGDVLSVKTPDGRNVDVQLNDKTSIVFTQPIQLSEIQPGDFLAVTSMKRSDGTLSAFEIRRFPKPSNPGHRPYEGHDDQTMTNAMVSATVESTKAHELTLSYEGGTQKVVVAPTAIVSTLVPGNRSQLITDAPVSLTAEPAADGKLVIRNVQVSRPGFVPKLSK